MIMNEVHAANGKTVTDVLYDFKQEFLDFFFTRIELAQAEVRQKTAVLKISIPMVAGGLLILTTAWFLLTAALVCVIAVAFEGSPWAYAISFAVVGGLYLIFGGLIALTGWHSLSKEGLKLEKTTRVLHEDKVWLQSEATRVQA